MEFSIETAPSGYRMPEYSAVAAPQDDGPHPVVVADLTARMADAQARQDLEAFVLARQVARDAMDRFREHPTEPRRRAAMAASVLARRANDVALKSAKAAQAAADQAASEYEKCAD